MEELAKEQEQLQAVVKRSMLEKRGRPSPPPSRTNSPSTYADNPRGSAAGARTTATRAESSDSDAKPLAKKVVQMGGAEEKKSTERRQKRKERTPDRNKEKKEEKQKEKDRRTYKDCRSRDREKECSRGKSNQKDTERSVRRSASGKDKGKDKSKAKSSRRSPDKKDRDRRARSRERRSRSQRRTTERGRSHEPRKESPSSSGWMPEMSFDIGSALDGKGRSSVYAPTECGVDGRWLWMWAWA